MSKIMTTQIIEKYSSATRRIKGDIYAALQACVNRNEMFELSNMRGEWRIGFEFHLEPSEYREALKTRPAKTLVETQPATTTYAEYRQAELSNGKTIKVGSSDPYRQNWIGPNGESLSVGRGATYPYIVSFV